MRFRYDILTYSEESNSIMKDSKNLFIINIILMGIIAVGEVTYRGFEAILAYSAKFNDGLLTSENFKSVALENMLHVGGSALIAIAVYLLLVLFNHYLVKKNKVNDLLALFVLNILVLIAMIVICIMFLF